MNNPFDTQQPPQTPAEDFSPSPEMSTGPTMVASGGGIKGFLRGPWRGEEKLWKVFWLYGVVASIVFQILMGVLGAVSVYAVIGFFVLIMLPYGIWNMVSLWRCAWNAGAKIWGIIVRILVVISIPGYILMIVGLLGAATLGTVAAVSGGGDIPMMQQSAPAAPMTIPDATTATVPIAPMADPAPEAVPVVPVSPVTPDGVAPVAAPVAPSASVPVAPVSAVPAAPAAAPTPAPAAAPDACEQRMHDFAIQNKADPAAYIAQNQAYLTQCRAVLAGQQATP